VKRLKGRQEQMGMPYWEMVFVYGCVVEAAVFIAFGTDNELVGGGVYFGLLAVIVGLRAERT